jgi:nicotinamide mononucleotide transporter
MSVLKQFFRNELSGWRPAEIIWLSFCLVSTLGISLYLKDSALGIAASLTGTAYTIIAGKGKISCYLFGVFNTLLYGFVSYQNRLFGEVMLNWGWYLPMMFAGMFFWKRNMNKSTETVYKSFLSIKERAITALLTLAGIAVYAFILHKMGDRSPVLDSTTTILSVTAMILTVKRCIEQWLIWTLVNVLSIWMWLLVYLKEGSSVAILLMWVMALANGIIFFIQWKKDLARQEKKSLEESRI